MGQQKCGAKIKHVLYVIKQKVLINNKQLLDEAEHDIKNYPDQGQCYLLKPDTDNS